MRALSSQLDLLPLAETVVIDGLRNLLLVFRLSLVLLKVVQHPFLIEIYQKATF